MANTTLLVEKREAVGKNAATRIRHSGKIPGILYGDGKEPVALTVDPEAVEEILALETGVNTIFELELQGTQQRRPAMVHEVQRHPIKPGLQHVDFLRINMQRKIHVRVHIKLAGLPNGVKNQGGILEFPSREVNLECLPGDIPRDLPIDVSHLNIGQSVRMSDLKLDQARYRVLDDPDTVIAVVAIPAAEKEATVAPAEAEVAAEPEVIKKGKEKAEGEGEGAAPEKSDKKPAAEGKDKKPEGKDKKPEGKEKK